MNSSGERERTANPGAREVAGVSARAPGGTVDAAEIVFLNECRSCHAAAGKACGYQEAVAVFCWLRVNDAFAAAAAWRAGLVDVRDRHVKVGPFGAGNVVVTKCLLCGAEMPARHSDRFNCGVAAGALGS